MVKIQEPVKCRSNNPLHESFADRHVCMSAHLPLKESKLVNGIQFQIILIFKEQKRKACPNHVICTGKEGEVNNNNNFLSTCNMRRS